MSDLEQLKIQNADLLRELSNIANAKWDGMTSLEYMAWARSRARFAIEKADNRLKYINY